MPVGLPFKAFEAFDIAAQLSDFESHPDTFLGEHAFLGFVFLKERFQLVAVFFEMDHPGIFLFVKFDIYVDAALADIRVEFFYFLAQGLIVDHCQTPLIFFQRGLAGSTPHEWQDSFFYGKR